MIDRETPRQSHDREEQRHAGKRGDRRRVDSPVMVEKRFGLGYTFNFGNRLVWSLLGFAVLLFVLGRVLIASA